MPFHRRLAAAARQELDEGDRRLVRAMHAETEGNPFFVGEVLRHLAETGALSQQKGRWVTTAAIEELGIPEGVREVVGRRLSRLSETANRVLTLAAVIGPEFEFTVLRLVADSITRAAMALIQMKGWSAPDGDTGFGQDTSRPPNDGRPPPHRAVPEHHARMLLQPLQTVRW